MSSSRHTRLTAATEESRRSCPLGVCDGDGWVVDEATNSASQCGCRAQRIAQARARRLRNVVPRRYRDLSWDRHPLPEIARLNPEEVRVVRRYCQDITARLRVGEGLWLLGPKGTGKTTLGYMVAAAGVAARHGVLSFNTVALINRLRASYDEGSRETIAQLIETLSTVDLLHLEDLRVVRPTDWVLEQLYLIVNNRYEEERAIVFTSDTGAVSKDQVGNEIPAEILPRELEEHVGPRTFSRLLQMCGDPLLIGGRDNRLDVDIRPPLPALDR